MVTVISPPSSEGVGNGTEKKKETTEGKGLPLSETKKERKTDTGNAISGRRDGRRIDF